MISGKQQSIMFFQYTTIKAVTLPHIFFIQQAGFNTPYYWEFFTSNAQCILTYVQSNKIENSSRI